MTPFSSDRIASGYEAPIDDNAAAHAGSKDDTEYGPAAGSRAVRCFREGKAVGVIGQPYRAPKSILQVSIEGFPDQPGRVGILNQARYR